MFNISLFFLFLRLSFSLDLFSEIVLCFFNDHLFRLPGKKNPEDLRDKLKMAIRKNDKDALEKVLQECVAAGFPQLTRDIDQAREVLETLGGGRKG